MTAKYSFNFSSRQKKREFPRKLIIGQGETETVGHVVLKLLAYLLFFRERLQIEPRLDSDRIPFTPDLLQLDYELRPRLWVECGECSIQKLNKLSVKIPEAEIWVVKRSSAAADDLVRAMKKAELRTGHYGIIGLELELFDEICALLQPRNEVVWYGGGFEPPSLKLEFNGLWFESGFTVTRF